MSCPTPNPHSCSKSGKGRVHLMDWEAPGSSSITDSNEKAPSSHWSFTMPFSMFYRPIRYRFDNPMVPSSNSIIANNHKEVLNLVLGHNPPPTPQDMYHPDTYPKDIYPLDTYPPPPGHLSPRTYTPWDRPLKLKERNLYLLCCN